MLEIAQPVMLLYTCVLYHDKNYDRHRQRAVDRACRRRHARYVSGPRQQSDVVREQNVYEQCADKRETALAELFPHYPLEEVIETSYCPFCEILESGRHRLKAAARNHCDDR